MTVKVDIKHECGCGFSTRDTDKAIAHCNDTNHTLTICGVISPEEKPKVAKPTSHVAAPHKPAKPREFENLRKKLRGE